MLIGTLTWTMKDCFTCCRGRLRRVRAVCPCVGGAWWPEEPKRCGGKREDRSTGCWTKATSGGVHVEGRPGQT